MAVSTSLQLEQTPAERLRWRSVLLAGARRLCVLFPVLASLGLFMRAYQANLFPRLDPAWFYTAMTLHGLGMVGLWYTTSFAGMAYLVARYVRMKAGVMWLSFTMTLAGVVLLLVACAVRFSPGWYFLYPLPFKSGGTWPAWATDVFLATLLVLGVAWILWILHLLWAIAHRYALSQALCWHYLRNATQPEVPPVVLVSTVSGIASLTALLAAVILLVFLGLERLLGIPADPLLMKNLTFYFGHTLINVAMYQGVAIIYELFPRYTGLPWKTAKPMVIGWNAVMVLVMFAFFHHLYMDFVQPRAVQVIGQIASYSSALPAAVVTILGLLAQVYHRKVRWTLASVLMFAGTMGWAIGGTAAVIDSTIVVNFRFHNTRWVPADSRTYVLMGVVRIVLGFSALFARGVSGEPKRSWFRESLAPLWLFVGYGFLSLCYIGGWHSVPRRYAGYPREVAEGSLYARLALMLVLPLILALLIYIWEVGKRWLAAYAAARRPS